MFLFKCDFEPPLQQVASNQHRYSQAAVQPALIEDIGRTCGCKNETFLMI